MSPRKKEEWIEVTEAAAIISENSEHEVSVDYVRLLANKGKIRRTEKNERENLYLKSDVAKIKVRQRKTISQDERYTSGVINPSKEEGSAGEDLSDAA